MKKHHIVTVAWSCVAVGAFALGWWTKPQQEQGGEQSRTGGVASSLAASSVSGRRSGPLGADGGRAGASGKATHAVALTTESIAGLGEEFRKATDPIVKREAFAQLLAGLTVENALEIRKQIEHLDSDDPNFRDFHFAWGKIGGADAVLHGAKTDKRDMAPTLAGWASADPAAAKAWYESLEEKRGKGPGREQLKEAFVHGLAIANPAMATDYVMGLGTAGDPRAKQMMGIVTEKMLTAGGPDSAAGWATELPDGDLRNHAFYEIARAQVRQDPAAAAAWAAPLAGGKSGGALVYGISSEWASRDGAATVKWLDSLSANQGPAYGPAMAGWAKADPLAASQHIADMPPSESRNHAIGGLIYSYRWEDPVASIAWANQITDAKSRQDTLTMTAEAYIRKDPAGAAAWLPSSGLPVETQQRLTGGKK